ncbi:MAG: VCBS repeat-containing protein, partial [Fuerstiella sp.]|nr:VCBS repeat-containing protein [Fuerstiella sp.]
RMNITAGQQPIRHPPPHGDENSYVMLHDMDGDGDHDCIYGAHSGYIWFHENRGSDSSPVMDTEGYRLPLIDGGFVKVGEAPAGRKPGFNFTDLQGARPKPAPADFDRDGRVDLVIGDTYGRVRYFRNEGCDENDRHRFGSPVMIHQARSRLSVHAADWTGNEFPDVFVITGSRVDLLPNRAVPGHSEFGEPEALNLPKSIGGFYGVSPGDINGDGDTDMVYHTSARITCYVERSFLEYGYRSATVVEVANRQK